MLRSRWIVLLLRVVLVVAALWLAVILVMSMPGELSDEAPAFRVPAQIVLSIVILSVLAVIVCIWRLLTLVRRDRIFSDEARRWVDAIVWALGANSSNPHLAGRGKLGVLVALGAAIVCGASVTLVNFFWNVGQQV